MYLFTGKNANPDQEILDIGNSKTIDTIFTTFVDNICDTLKVEDFRKVRRNCVLNVNKTGGLSLPKDILDKIKNAENFDDLVDTLSMCDTCTPYWNWMNIRMLEKMVGNCLPAKRLIYQYKSEVYSRKLKDVLSEFPNFDIPTNKYTEVKVKWKKEFNDLIIKDIVKQWNEIEKTFDVKEAMLLKSITEGCVEICWLLPNDLVDHAKKLATPELFPEMLYLKIGKDFVKDDITGM